MEARTKQAAHPHSLTPESRYKKQRVIPKKQPKASSKKQPKVPAQQPKVPEVKKLVPIVSPVNVAIPDTDEIKEIRVGFYSTRGGRPHNVIFTIKNQKFGEYIINLCDRTILVREDELTPMEIYILLDSIADHGIKRTHESKTLMKEEWNCCDAKLRSINRKQTFSVFKQPEGVLVIREVGPVRLSGDIPFYPIPTSKFDDLRIGFYETEIGEFSDKLEWSNVLFTLEDPVVGAALISVCEKSTSSSLDSVFTLLKFLVKNKEEDSEVFKKDYESICGKSYSLWSFYKKFGPLRFKVVRESIWRINVDAPFYPCSLLEPTHNYQSDSSASESGNSSSKSSD